MRTSSQAFHAHRPSGHSRARSLEGSRWHVAPFAFVYAVTSCILVLGLSYGAVELAPLIGGATAAARQRGDLALMGYLLPILSGLFSIVYLVFLAALFDRWRSLTWRELAFASAASAGVTAFVFVAFGWLLQLTHPLFIDQITSIVISVAMVVVPAFVVLDGLKRHGERIQHQRKKAL